MCIDNLTVCNPINTVASYGLDFYTHVTHTHNAAVPIHQPKNIWKDVMTLISQLIPHSHPTTMSSTFHDFEGCHTFHACILLSHKYAASAAMDDAAAYGTRSLGEGLGLDYNSIDNQVFQVLSGGILSFIHNLSSACMGVTLHPRPEMILYPPHRINSLPAKPPSTMLTPFSPAVIEAIALHRSVITHIPLYIHPSPPAIPPATHASMAPFLPGDGIDIVLHHFACEGGPYLCSDAFTPNFGIGITPYPIYIAPPAAIEAHLAKYHREGKMLVLPLSVAQTACLADDLALHVSNVFIQPKVGEEAGRMCADYSHPLHASMKFRGKKGLNQRYFGPTRNPQAADLCQLHINAIHTFPGQPIFACRMDVAAAYNRIRVRPKGCHPGQPTISC